MAFDEGLAERIRDVLRGEPGIVEKRMFGGVAFMAGDRMFVGIIGDGLMVRVGPEEHEAALKRPHVRIMDFTGRPMKGFLVVDPPGIENDEQLEGWIAQTRRFVKTLGAKKVPAVGAGGRKSGKKSKTRTKSRVKATKKKRKKVSEGPRKKPAKKRKKVLTASRKKPAKVKKAKKAKKAKKERGGKH